MDNLNKSDFRKFCINKLRNIPRFNKLRNNKYISNEILSIIKKNKVKNILLYLPLKIEVDLKEIIFYLRKNNINVFVPYMTGINTFKIVPYRLPLTKKKYNIYETNNSFLKCKIKLDLAIVPIIGFDDSFRRVGFGVGFYDRFFSSLKHKPKIIFTQMCECKSTKIITNAFDVKADLIITNKGKLWN